jgi:DNA-binding SARP family transcriptional activator
MAAWRLRVLGEVALEGEGARLALERKTAALLAYLALEGAAPRSKLAGLLWPEVDEAKARNNLRQTLHRLRHHVGCDLVIPHDPLRLGELEVDAARFKLLAFEGKYQALLSLSTAILPHFDYDDLPEFADWLYAERERLVALHAEALEAECERLTSEGEHAAALACADRLIAIDPVSEEAYRRAMRLHHLFGDRAGALKVFERCRAALKRELGVAPLPETAELAAEIARGTLLPKVAKARPVIPLSIQRPPVLAGRAREWQLLEEAWQRGQIVFIAGEAGVGKSRLLQDFLASKGPYALFYGRPGDASIPYAFHARAWRQVLTTFPDLALPPWAGRELSRILPELAQEPLPPMASEEDKLRLFEAKAELVSLAASRGWQAFAADDLHYCDDASFEAGVYLLNKFAPTPSPDKPRSLYAFRSGELPAHLRERVQQLVDTGLAVLIELEPLDEAGVHELVAGLKLSLEMPVTPLARFTGGNPFFIVQTIKSLWESGQLGTSLGHLPSSGRVRSLIAERFARLSAQARRLCWGAAVAGEDFGLEPIAHMLEVTPLELAEPWQELERRQILTSRGFSHDLLYETALELIPAPVKSLLHRRCAEYLAAQGANPAHIAQHYLEAGEGAAAIPWLLAAAQAARGALLLEEAVGFYERAVGLLETKGEPQELFEALLLLEDTLQLMDYGQRHEKVIEKLIQRAVTSEQQALAWNARANYFGEQGRGQESERAARTGLELARAAGHPGLTGQLLKNLGYALLKQDKIPEAIAHLKESEQPLRASGDELWLADLYSTLSNALTELDRYQEAITYRRLALRSLAKPATPIEHANELIGIAINYRSFGRSQDALRTLGEVELLLEDARSSPLITLLYWMVRCGALSDLVRYADALACAKQALELADSVDHWLSGAALKYAAQLQLLLGRATEAAQLVVRGLAYAGLTGQQRSVLLMTQADIHAALGQPATELIAEAERALAPSGRQLTRGNLLVVKAGVLPAAAAYQAAREAAVLAERLGLYSLRIAAETRCAQALLALGEPERALEPTSSAVTLLKTYHPTDFYVGEVLLTQYRVLAALHDPAALEHLQSCRRWLLEVADQHVPDQYRRSFLENNPVNRAILEAVRHAGL